MYRNSKFVFVFLTKKMLKKTPSKVEYYSKIAETLSTAGRPIQNKPKSKTICFIKTAHRVTYISNDFGL